MQTLQKTPTIVIPNTTPSLDWQDYNNILLADGTFAVSTGNTQILTVGNFNLNFAQGDIITNFIVGIKGYRGSFNTTLDIYAVDDTSGTAIDYQLLPSYQGFNGVNTLWTLPSTLFGTTWTPTQGNNIKIKVIADGELHLDTITLIGVYTPAATSSLNYGTLFGLFQPGDVITGVTSGATAIVVTDDGVSFMTITNVSGVFQIGETINGVPSGASAVVVSPYLSGQFVCDEYVQAQKFQLAQSITSTSLYCLVNSFNYPDGITPIEIGDFWGNAMITLDQGVEGSEENCRITNIEHNYNGTQYTRLSFTDLSNRGLGMNYPYTSVGANIKDHDGTTELVISNSAPFYDRFLKKCHIDALVSAPITIQDEGINLTTSLHLMNFIGDGVVATLSALHEVLVEITDHFVLVDGSDTVQGYLDDKIELIAGANVTIGKSILFPGVNEKIRYTISATGGGGGGGHIIADDGVNFPPEPILDFLNFFTITDIPGTTRTTVAINCTELGNDVDLINALTSNTLFQTLVQAFTAGQGGYQIDQSPLGTASTYGAIAGVIGGGNTQFIVSLTEYLPGKMLVFSSDPLTGIVQQLGTGAEWVETDPANGVFNFVTAPNPGDIITVVYETGSSVPIDELVKVSVADTNAGYLQPKINVHSSDGSAVVSETITTPGGNEVLDIDITGAGSGGGTFASGSQFLPIGVYEYYNNNGSISSSGTTPVHTFRDTVTNRLYVHTYLTGANNLVIWKNDYGSYYVEDASVSIPTINAGASDGWAAGALGYRAYIWTTDGTYLYLTRTQYKYTGSGGSQTKTVYIDVIRFDLDGTYHAGDYVNLYTHTANAYSGTWDDIYKNMCIVGTNLYLPYKEATPTAQTRKYVITHGPFALTLTTTYAGYMNDGYSLTYDSNTSIFYGTNLLGTIITKYTIVGANVVTGATKTYAEFVYGGIGSIVNSVPEYTIADLEFSASSYRIFVIDEMTNYYRQGGSPPVTAYQTSYWLTSYSYPKW